VYVADVEGKRLFAEEAATTADVGSVNEPYGRPRDDRNAKRRFVVADLASPAQPKAISNRNRLGYADLPPDVIVKNYRLGFDPYEFVGCYKGRQSFFAMMSGPVPHGSRLHVVFAQRFGFSERQLLGGLGGR
jgi:hypothetical protein